MKLLFSKCNEIRLRLCTCYIMIKAEGSIHIDLNIRIRGRYAVGLKLSRK